MFARLSARIALTSTVLATAIAPPTVMAASGPSPAPVCAKTSNVPGADWGSAQPAGWDLAKLDQAHAYWESLDSAAVMIVHRGRVIASWGEVEKPFTAQSVRKALLNSLIGVAVSQGKLSLDNSLAELGIDDTKPELTDAERRARVRDLLMSRSGIFHSALYEVGAWKQFREALAKRKTANPESFRPGAYWVYNNWDFNALGTIVEKSLGVSIGPAFKRYIASPIGMQDFKAEHVEYTQKIDATEQRFKNWSEHRAYVFDISTRDLARFGLLYLNCGKWGQKQVIPRQWVIASTSGVDTRKGRGPDEQTTEFGDYGYLWQVDRPGSRRLANLELRSPIYMATGNRGHFMIVSPALDLIIVHQVATVGGVSPAAQQKRFLEGSPNVTERELERLFAAIINAHPTARSAWIKAPAI